MTTTLSDILTADRICRDQGKSQFHASMAMVVRPEFDETICRVDVRPDTPVVLKSNGSYRPEAGEYLFGFGHHIPLLQFADLPHPLLVAIGRNQQAPTFPGYLSNSGGWARCSEELFAPGHTALREGNEEVILGSSTRGIARLSSMNDHAPERLQQLGIGSHDRFTLACTPYCARPMGMLVVTLTPPPRIDVRPMSTRSFRMLVVLDEEHRRIECAVASYIQMGIPLADFRIWDGEAANGELLHRPMYLLDPDGTIVASYQYGQPMPQLRRNVARQLQAQLTPDLKQFLEVWRAHPVR